MSPLLAGSDMTTRLRRARPLLLGTVVLIHLQAREDTGAGANGRSLEQAANAALRAIADVERVMSAHRPGSDLGRIARAVPGSILAVHPHTTAVLKLAQHWYSISRGAFDPCAAVRQLAKRSRRPTFEWDPASSGSPRDIQVVSTTEILVHRPVQMDFGRIAKGYAVDLAVETLREWGVESALANAGGDMRSQGPRAWPVEVRGRVGLRSEVPCTLRQLSDAAIASSEAPGGAGEFVRTVRRSGTPRWTSCTVTARDCVTADPLTKWGLQSSEASPRLRRALHTYRANLWRS